MTALLSDPFTGKTPTEVTALHAMAEAHDAKAWDKVIAVGNAWVEARGGLPAVAAIWHSQALQATGRTAEGAKWADASVTQMPAVEVIGRCASLATQTSAYTRLGQYARARQSMKRMVDIDVRSIDPLHMTDAVFAGMCDAREKQGHVMLALGEKYWEKAWLQMEERLLVPGRGLPEGMTPWDGVERCPVAVLHEQGIGDGLLMARWLPWVAETTGHPVTWFGPALLRDWMAEVPGVVIGEESDALAFAGKSAMMMSLPALARVKHRGHIPAPVAPESLLRARAYRTYETVRVGVCWKGSASGWHDFERSYTQAQLGPILAPLDKVEFVNLQHGLDVESPLTRVDFADMMDTGRTIASCHLVVTVDTSVAHVAGSLGIPTIVMLPTVPDWRYDWPHGGGSAFYPALTAVRRRTATDTAHIRYVRGLVERYAGAILRATAS